MYQFFTNWSDWLKNTLLLDVNCLAAQKCFAGTGCTKHENMSFMNISIFPSWFYWPGEESRKSEYVDNCHLRAEAATFKRGMQGSLQHVCDPSIHYLAEQGRAGCLFFFLFFLLILPHFFWVQTWWFEGQLTALMMPSVASKGPLQQCLSQIDAQDESSCWSSDLEASCPACLSPLCLFLYSPAMLGCRWPGGKGTDMLLHFKQLPPQGRCISSDWGLGKWIRVNLAGLCCCCYCFPWWYWRCLGSEVT